MNTIIKSLKAVSDHNRLKVLAGLMEYDELCACQITELLQVTGATASRHLSVLINADLISSRKAGRWIYYRLKRENINHQQLIEWLKDKLANTSEIISIRKTLAGIVSLRPEDICRKQRGEKCCPTTEHNRLCRNSVACDIQAQG
jgi:ArsR family transcriptional regulator, arsenate/arsenite/antimonite-responsive transcriptional repressor